MNKKAYIKPDMNVVKLHRLQLLTASVTLNVYDKQGDNPEENVEDFDDLL